MKKKLILMLLLAVLMLLSLVGCGSTSDSTKAKNGFYKVCGVSYPAELGAPVLGEAAGELVSQDLPTAAEQITNVGDAFSFIAASEHFDQPYEMCKAFATLLSFDYDEVGLIFLSSSNNDYCLAYVKSEETYYPFDLFGMDEAWILDQKYDCISDTDLNALAERLMKTCPYNGEETPMSGKYIPMTSWRVEVMSSSTKASDFPEEHEKLMGRIYTDEELQAFVDADLTLQEACEKLSTVSDAMQYLYLRGYEFAPEDAGIGPELRFELNSGACVGGSGLFNALLEDDFDAQGYVYIFYARGEHVFNYFVVDGVYFFCDFVSVFSQNGTYPNKTPICHVTTNPDTIYDAWFKIEPNGLNDSNSDMYLACMYTMAYCGDPTMPATRLIDSPTGMSARVPLSTAEIENQKILFIRDGYTFEFGSRYPSELGKPVLGEAAAELATTVSFSEAAAKIDNVEDALNYLSALGSFDQPTEICELFVDLLAADYDELGLIYLTRPDNGYCVAYVKSGDTYYPFDPFSMEYAWTLDPQYNCVSDTDLDALCERLMSTCPYINGAPMTSWRVEKR